MQKKTKTKKFKIATSAKAPYMGKIWFLRHQIFFCKYFWDNSYLGHTSESIPHPCFNCGWLAEYKRKQKTYTWSKLSCPILSMILNQLVLNCLTICLTTTRFFWGLFPRVSWELPPNFVWIYIWMQRRLSWAKGNLQNLAVSKMTFKKVRQSFSWEYILLSGLKFGQSTFWVFWFAVLASTCGLKHVLRPVFRYLLFCVISTEGVLRRPMTFDIHPIHPIPSINPT